MYIAQSKRKENIAEYILYLWQLEDLLRALQFSPEAVYSQLVQKQELYGAVAPELPGLKSKLGKPGMSDVELFFRALYAVMLYRIKGDRSKQGYIDDVIGLISPVVAELATMFRRIERGEVDLFGDKKE